VFDLPQAKTKIKWVSTVCATDQQQHTKKNACYSVLTACQVEEGVLLVVVLDMMLMGAVFLPVVKLGGALLL
jgi:hypothetical protein